MSPPKRAWRGTASGAAPGPAAHAATALPWTATRRSQGAAGGGALKLTRHRRYGLGRDRRHQVDIDGRAEDRGRPHRGSRVAQPAQPAPHGLDDGGGQRTVGGTGQLREEKRVTSAALM